MQKMRIGNRWAGKRKWKIRSFAESNEDGMYVKKTLKAWLKRAKKIKTKKTKEIRSAILVYHSKPQSNTKSKARDTKLQPVSCLPI